MKIQRGIVKYKDRNDIVCTYALTDDGKQYYFLDETDAKKFSNGNRIATTVLVEAVDPMVKATNVGVIDQNGVVVIPFENRSIRLANDNVIIVEKAVPTSQSVLDAIELRNDPSSAAQLVSTPATIKDKLKTQMGVEGNYLFNDQFSEATICDINGTNLVGGENYSFISMANDRLYLSKNTVDSPISEFSLTTYELVASQPVAATDAIDVSAAAVDQQVVEGALASESVAVQETVAPTEEVVVPTEDVAVPTEEVTVPTEEVAVPTEEVAAPTEEVAVPVEAMASVEGFGAPTDVSEPVGEVTPEGVDSSATGESTEEVKEDVVHEVIDIPEDTPEESVEATTAESIPDAMDGPETGLESAPQEFSTEDTSISNDLKAFANGAPSDGEVPEVPVDEAVVEAPPIVEEENNDNAMPEEPTEEAEETQDEAKDVEETPLDDIAPVSEADESPVDTHEGVKEISAEDVQEAISGDAKEEVFSDSVTAPSEEQDEIREVIEPVSIDAETVFATVDRNNNGIIDSDEVMVPQKTSRSAPQPEKHLLTDIFSTTIPEKDYGLSSYHTPSSYDSLLTDIQSDRVSYDSYGSIGGDNIMADVARSMSELMRQNKEQRGVITQYQNKVESLESQARILAEKFKDQSVRYEALSSKLRSLDEATGRLESRNQLLESRVHDQEKIIASQDRELKVLRPQVEGKQDLVRLLADARTLLGSENSYEYDDGNSYYGRRAA